MPTEAKRETIAELREELAKARTLIVSEYRNSLRSGAPCASRTSITGSSRTA